MFPVTLHGPRVGLREWQEGDAPAIFAYASKPVVSTHVPWQTHASIEETEEYLAGLLEAARAEERASFNLAAVTTEGQVVGAGRIAVLNARHRRGDLGYVLHPDRWSQGFGTEIARLLVDFGIATLGLHRIEATAHPDNIGSQRVLEKVGMRYEGRFRDHMVANGEWRDSLGYAVLDSDDSDDSDDTAAE